MGEHLRLTIEAMDRRAGVTGQAPVIKSGGQYKLAHGVPERMDWSPPLLTDTEAPELVAPVPPAPGASEASGKQGPLSRAVGKVAAGFIKRGDQLEELSRARSNNVRIESGLDSAEQNRTISPGAPRRFHNKLQGYRDKQGKPDRHLKEVTNEKLRLRMISNASRYDSGGKRNALTEDISRLRYLENLKKNPMVHASVVLSDGRSVDISYPAIDTYVAPLLSDAERQVRRAEIAKASAVQNRVIAQAVEYWKARNPDRYAPIPEADAGGLIDLTESGIGIVPEDLDRMIRAQERKVEKALWLDIFNAPAEALERINNDPNLTPTQRKNEVSIVRKAIALHERHERLKAKQKGAATGTDKIGQKLAKKAGHRKAGGQKMIAVSQKLDEGVGATRRGIAKTARVAGKGIAIGAHAAGKAGAAGARIVGKGVEIGLEKTGEVAENQLEVHRVVMSELGKDIADSKAQAREDIAKAAEIGREKLDKLGQRREEKMQARMDAVINPDNSAAKRVRNAIDPRNIAPIAVAKQLAAVRKRRKDRAGS